MSKNKKIAVKLTSVLLAAGMIMTSSVLLAQVKIGSNPTVIGANDNLQIEATNGSKTISNKANGQFSVSTPADPVKFEGLQLSSSANNKTLVVNPADGIIKYANAAPTLALVAQGTGEQLFLAGSFAANSNSNPPTVLSFSAADINLNLGAATLSNNEFTIAESGVYDLSSLSNFLGTGTWNGAGMSINLNIQKQATGTSTWVGIAGSRTFYFSDCVGAALTCQTSSVVSLNSGDKIRAVIFRGNGGYLTGTVSVGTGLSNNGVPFTKSLRIVKLN